ncbi:hypothetical protein Y032_0873g2805 [Ancylostoma ceylanicum]|uniref:Uncharacterized protein n=1 Tax=Ancylostoma ceylanicum TaxID=53326 RepID=A0A016WAH7_9BILA|nr:hypothetical protein Y032_0873g2805 [Ancylostoma ceylanicum]
MERTIRMLQADHDRTGRTMDFHCVGISNRGWQSGSSAGVSEERWRSRRSGPCEGAVVFVPFRAVGVAIQRYSLNDEYG